MSVLVIGSGFLGSYLVNALIQQEHEVHVLDVVIPHSPPSSPLFHFHHGDICRLGDVLCTIDSIKTISAVFHTASVTDPFDESLLKKVNVTGTKNVIEACLRGGIDKLIYTSSSSVVIDGNDIRNGDESLPYPKEFLNAYSKSKAMAEVAILKANGLVNIRNQSLKTCVIRPHAMFGPGDTHFISQLLIKARNGEITHRIGDGANLVDFTYVENVVHALLLCYFKLCEGANIGGQIYFITNGEPRPFWSFIATLLTKMGCVGYFFWELCGTQCTDLRVSFHFEWRMRLRGLRKLCTECSDG